MIATIIIVSLAFLWLLVESRCLTVRLEAGNHTKLLSDHFDSDFDAPTKELTLAAWLSTVTPEDLYGL